MKFVLIEDPAAKLAAFRKGDVDIMWNTRHTGRVRLPCSVENNQRAKSIIMQDWSRGADGIVSLSRSSRSKTSRAADRRTQFKPPISSALPVGAERPFAAGPHRRREEHIFTQDAPPAAATVRPARWMPRVTWEPDLSGAVEARGDEANSRLHDSGHETSCRHALRAQRHLDKAPQSVRDFVHGWFEG